MRGGGVVWNTLLTGFLTTILSVDMGAWENKLAVSDTANIGFCGH